MDIANPAILETTGGNYILGGYMELSPERPGNGGFYDGWLVKLSIEGEILWEKQIGGGGMILSMMY